mmetsp:Transcript_20195/g.33135  ORF Transcript_20195/g.33135 Transcript_20195/m.33135 type:complete len:211 (+) Transcript_20195:841-1473(+)
MDPQGPVVVQHRIELREVDDAIAVDAWHLLIHQGYQGLGVLRGAPRPVHGGPQGAEAVRVRRRDVEQRHVGADQAPAEEQRQVPQVDGNRLRIASHDLLTQVGSHKGGHGSDTLGRFRVVQGCRSRPFQVHVDGPQIPKFFCLGHIDHPLHQRLWCGSACVNENHAVAFQVRLQSFLRRLADPRTFPQADRIPFHAKLVDVQRRAQAAGC